MRTSYARVGGSRPAPAPRGLQKVLLEEQIQDIIRRETSRADRTGRQFSVVLFRVKAARRWSVSACRIARVLLSRVRQTDDVGWFDELHLCAVLPETPADGARVFASRACDEIATRQPRPQSIVYGYPGTLSDGEELADVHADDGEVPFHADDDDDDDGNGNGNARHNGHSHGNGRANGNGHRNGHGNGHANGNGHGLAIGLTNDHSVLDLPIRPRSAPRNSQDGTDGAVALAEPETEFDREQLDESFLEGVLSALTEPQPAPVKVKKVASKPDAALEDFFIRPMPWWKRAFDLVGASVGLVLIAPVLTVAAIGIKLTSPGPVVFKQKRSGLGGRPFTIYKLRTMCVGAEKKQAELRALNEQDGPAFKLTADPRVTRIGKLLRKTSIDELPQLLNVIKGDMSLVGPRPLPVLEQDGCQPWQRHRLNVTPGLTCIWQVDGRSEVTFDEWVRMDVKYMRRQSLWHDLSILLRTVPSVLLRKGAK